MSTHWEKFVGDRGEFGIRLAFLPDPDEGKGATREESLSWGSFELWVDGKDLCAHLEQGEPVESVYWYMLPVIQWLATNWEPLFHEERHPGKNAKDDAWSTLQATWSPPPSLDEDQQERWEEEWQSWWNRHALQSCRNGGLFPDVLIRRWRDQLEISWGPSPIAGAPDHFRFLAPCGFARLEPTKVAEPLFDVISSATDFLIGRAPDSHLLTAIHGEIEAIRRPSRDRRLALLAGIGQRYEDRFAGWNRVRSYFPTVREDVAASLFGSNGSSLVLTGTCQAALMFGSVAPTISPDDAMALAEWLVRLYSSESGNAALERFGRSHPLDENDQPAWDQGYQLARKFLDELGSLPDDKDWIDVEQIYDSLDVERDDIGLSDANVRAVSMASPKHRPCSLLNVNHPTHGTYTGRRFTLAHELCHLLYDRSYGWQLAIASGPWAPRDLERRANAFAAMLLMPTELVLRVVRSLTVPLDSLAAVRQVARALRTSPTATIEHLGNLDLLDEADRERIRLEAEKQLTTEEDGPSS